MRGRSYNYSPSPPRVYGRREGRSPSPRGRHGGRSRDLPTSLLVRNLRHDCRPEDLRRPFGQFGPIKDIYLPRDYYSGEPRGFGFVQYVDPADAADAKYEMDGQILLGRELTVVFAEENRKRPADMRARERVRSWSDDNWRLSSYSRSPRYARSRSRSRSYYSPSPRRQYSRSPPQDDRRGYLKRDSPSPQHHDHSYSRSSLHCDGSYSQSRHHKRSYSRSPLSDVSRSRSPVGNQSEREKSVSRSQ